MGLETLDHSINNILFIALGGSIYRLWGVTVTTEAIGTMSTKCHAQQMQVLGFTCRARLKETQTETLLKAAQAMTKP